MRKEGPLDKYSDFRKDDPIGRLIVHYFFPSDFVYRDFKRVERALSAQKRRTRWRASQESCYMRLWLATLFAVAEGYRSLDLRDDEIDDLLLSPHLESLRHFRNGTFHYQKNPAKQVQFFLGEEDRLDWAQRLHLTFGRFFSDYRVKTIVANFRAYKKAADSTAT